MLVTRDANPFSATAMHTGAEMPKRKLNELVLSDASWARIAPHIIGNKKGRRSGFRVSDCW